VCVRVLRASVCVNSTAGCSCLFVQYRRDCLQLGCGGRSHRFHGSSGDVLFRLLVERNKQFVEQPRRRALPLVHHVARHVRVKRDLEQTKCRLESTEIIELCLRRPGHVTYVTRHTSSYMTWHCSASRWLKNSTVLLTARTATTTSTTNFWYLMI